MIQEFIKKVGEFHDAFGVKRGNVDVQLRYNLFKEEYEEYLDAKNLVQKADAIVDMLYIACGTVDLHEWLYLDSQTKFDFVEECVLTNVYIDATNDYLIKSIKDINEQYFNEGNEDYTIYGVIMLVLVLSLSYNEGILYKLPKLFQEVHNSNMSKLENGKPIFREDGKILKGKNYFKPNLEKILF